MLESDVGTTGAVREALQQEHADTLEAGYESALLARTVRVRPMGVAEYRVSPLHYHVETVLHELRQPRPQGGKAARAPKHARCGGKVAPPAAAAAVDEDDYVSPISIETYVEFRAKTTCARLQSTAPRLASKLNNLKVVVFIMTSGGGVLGLVGYGSWVALSLPFAADLSLLIDCRCASCQS